MKFTTTTTTTTTTALLLSNAASVVLAFAPPRPHSTTPTATQTTQFQPIRQQQQRQTTTTTTTRRLLFPDPSTLESSTILTSYDLIEGLVSTVGSLALLGSVGFGVFSGMKDEDWEYEYKAGNDEAKLKYGTNDNADLALIGVSMEEVAVDMVKASEITAAQKSFFGKGEDEAKSSATPSSSSSSSPPPAPKAKEPSVVTSTTVQVAVPKTSETVLKATEVARSEVTKKGMQETKEKMSSKSLSTATSAAAATATTTTTAADEVVKSSSSEVKKKKEEDKGIKRKLVKGVTLIVAAGAVAVARNVVKAWLGRGML